MIDYVIKGIFIAILYFEFTKTNDTNLKNIVTFTAFYITMIFGAKLTNIDPNVITTAFLSKTVFTLVDERIKRKNETLKNIN
jgi:sorbitol-specific phosphotransferase system component IIBC